jgi:hypothetical protein
VIPIVISLPPAAPAAAARTAAWNAGTSPTSWSAANEPITAAGSRSEITAAARPIAAHESRGAGSIRMLSCGTAGSWRATAAACATPVTTIVVAGAASPSSRAAVACSSDAAVPVSGCRNLGLPARDSGHSLVPLPPAGMTA